MSDVSVLVLRAAGVNCERELCHAFAHAGADRVELEHIRALARDPTGLERARILAIPGGFSYGDDIYAGRLLGLELRRRLGERLDGWLAAGGLVFGVCNGFQVLCASGLLPALPDDVAAEAAGAALAGNDHGRFVDRWLELETLASVSVWAPPAGTRLLLPVAHAEGRFVTTPDRLEKLEAARQIVFRYAPGDNPNGSLADIAGICDPTGRILGLMPHPERHVLGLQHPRWTREGLRRHGDGLGIFERGVHHAREQRS
jgi:phosphoribosylformylglycinamidine synthase